VVAAAGRQEGAGAAENGISLGPGGRRGGGAEQQTSTETLAQIWACAHP